MRNTIRHLALSTALTLCSPAFAASFDAQAVNGADIAALPGEAPNATPSEPDPAIVHLQVLLDRAGASPGVIDGYFGENLNKAVAGFEAMQDMPVDGKLDNKVLDRLEDKVPVIQAYVITADDAKDLVERIPNDYAEQAKMEHLAYTNVEEKLAERFHMDVGLLKALNPSAAFTPGEKIEVAMPGAAKSGTVKRIEIRRRSAEAFAFAEDGSLLSVYPATIGSEDSPSPKGPIR